MSATPKLAIIGAGMMGSGIAASAALAGNEVVLCDAEFHDHGARRRFGPR